MPQRRQPKEHEQHRAPLQLPPDEPTRVIDEDSYDQTLEALVGALEARDRQTKGRYARMTEYTLDIARHVGFRADTPAWHDLKRAALLLDVGKIGVSEFILHKPGPLTTEEWHELRLHPLIGHEMLRNVEILSGAAAMILAHHERFDGKGYPYGLSGDQIPLGARILAIADTFDAMTSDRPYRRGLPPDAAKEEIVRHSGTQFDPRVVEAFLECYERWFQEPSRLSARPSSDDQPAEMAWVEANRRELEMEHPGKWIAIHGDEVVAVDEELAAVIRQATAKGVEDPFVVAMKSKDRQDTIEVAQWL